MIKQFHPLSQSELTKSVRNGEARQYGMRHISEAIREFEESLASDDHHRRQLLEYVQRRRQRTKEVPDNHWHVYELCKSIYELAELDRVDFNGASLDEKINFIRHLVPFVGSAVLREGVEEYHHSRMNQNWQMSFLTDAAHDGTRIQ